jgi:hypothetical protein
MLLHSIVPLRISLSVKNRIRHKAKYIHDVMFNNYDHYTEQCIDWWYIRHYTAKLSLDSANNFIQYLQNKDNIDQHSIGLVLIHYFCKLQKKLPQIYIESDINEKNLIDNIISNIYHKPLLVSKPMTLDLYIDFFHLYNRLKM